MTHDLTPLLREAADALWLIPQHAGLAQRLQHAAERTRPSETEVTEVVAVESAHWRERITESACSAEARDAALVAHDRFVSRLTAALSNPPLPSAEPVARKFSPEHVRAMSELEFSHGVGVGSSGDDGVTRVAQYVVTQHAEKRAFPWIGPDSTVLLARACLYTTPPAAAQDTVRLDWLEARPWAAYRYEDGRNGLDYDNPECATCGHVHDNACAAGDCECAAHANTDAPMHEAAATSLRAAIDNAMDAGES